jgi:hypothetical protein
MAQQQTSVSTTPRHDPLGRLVVGVFWAMLGPGLLGLCTMQIVAKRQAVLGVTDALFWGLAGAMLLARYLDSTKYQRATADGRPQVMGSWHRYAQALGSVAPALWIAAHGLAYILGR